MIDAGIVLIEPRTDLYTADLATLTHAELVALEKSPRYANVATSIPQGFHLLDDYEVAFKAMRPCITTVKTALS